jgi:outer membrane protein TolC
MSPALQVARAEILVAEKRLERVRGSFRPTASLSIELQDEDTAGSLFGGSSQVQSTEIGLNINMSIYEGGIRRSRVREAETRIEISRMRLEQLEELTARRYGALISALDRSEQGLQTLGQEQRLANQRYNAALEQEDAGRVGPEVSMEARLRSDTLRLRSQASRLRSIQLQAEIYALFGALDIAALSRQFGQ